ncbi:MAG: hypothetical protein U0401_02505 [Anaerolineae bacterium]
MSSYWEKRQKLKYYREALRLAKKYAPAGGSILDVGSYDCEYITWFDWFEKKQVIDLTKPVILDGVISTTGNFMEFECANLFDLVLCLQVLEHLHNPKEFCQKLLVTGRLIIISVPYQWERGRSASHVQDPVDEHKLQGWTGKPWKEMTIVTDGRCDRLVAVYEGNP